MFLGARPARKLLGRVIAHCCVLAVLVRQADRLLIAPQDLRTADATRASEIYAGRFAFAGKVVICDARSPFEIAPPSDDWAVALLGFSWLRPSARRRIRHHPRQRPRAGRRMDHPAGARGDRGRLAAGRAGAARSSPGSARRRWCSTTPTCGSIAASCAASTRQVRHLRAHAADARDGVPRCLAMIALMYASLCMAGQRGTSAARTKRLSDELERQILPDGGHISRNPGALIELLVDLLPLRAGVHRAQRRAAAGAAQRHRPHDADAALLPARRRQFRAVQRHGADAARPLATILAYDDARGTPVANAPHSGYQRLEAGTAGADGHRPRRRRCR